MKKTSPITPEQQQHRERAAMRSTKHLCKLYEACTPIELLNSLHDWALHYMEAATEAGFDPIHISNEMYTLKHLTVFIASTAKEIPDPQLWEHPGLDNDPRGPI